MSEIPKIYSEQIDSPKDTTEKVILNETQQKIQDLENKLLTLWYTKKISENIKNTLYKWLTWDPSIKNDPDAKVTIEMFKTFEKRYKDAISESKVTQQELENLVKMWDKFEFQAWTNESWEVNEFSNEKLKTISNREFLSLDKSERLQYVTKNNVDSENISNWTVDNLEFTFTYDWEFNKDLYVLTTAGQVLPKEVWTVTVLWVEYSRKWIDWEFFNWNNRLKIHEWTDLDVNQLRTQEQLENMKFKNIELLEGFPQEQQGIVKEGLERGFTDKELISLLYEVLVNSKNIDKKVRIEEIFTQVDRIRDMFWLEVNDPKLRKLVVDTDKDWIMDWLNNTDLPIVWEWIIDSREQHPSWYEKYSSVVKEVTSRYSNITEENLKTLIDHENWSWNPNAKAPWSSAHGLGQMINSTWLTYGKWLDRSNPKDQLEATCRYLNSIMNRQNCDIDLAMAYYNTWEWIMNISNFKAQEYARKNPAIDRKIPDGEYIDAKTYFRWAIAYYNNKNFDEVTI